MRWAVLLEDLFWAAFSCEIYYFLVGNRNGSPVVYVRSQERKKKPRKRQYESPIRLPSSDFSALPFPTPSRSTTWHGWTGLAGLIILVHRYSNRTLTIGAHSELFGLGAWQWKVAKIYPSPRSRALGTGGRAGPQIPMRLAHGSPFPLLFAHDVETAASGDHSVQPLTAFLIPPWRYPWASVEVRKITQAVNRSRTSSQIQDAIHHSKNINLSS